MIKRSLLHRNVKVSSNKQNDAQGSVFYVRLRDTESPERNLDSKPEEKILKIVKITHT